MSFSKYQTRPDLEEDRPYSSLSDGHSGAALAIDETDGEDYDFMTDLYPFSNKEQRDTTIEAAVTVAESPMNTTASTSANTPTPWPEHEASFEVRRYINTDNWEVTLGSGELIALLLFWTLCYELAIAIWIVLLCACLDVAGKWRYLRESLIMN